MSRMIVRTPVDGYTGPGWGLYFVNGEAQTEDAALAESLQKKGYIIVSAEPPAQPKKPAAKKAAAKE